MVNPALRWESRNFPTAADFHPIFQRFTHVPVTNLKMHLTLSSSSQKPPFTLHIASRHSGGGGGCQLKLFCNLVSRLMRSMLQLFKWGWSCYPRFLVILLENVTQGTAALRPSSLQTSGPRFRLWPLWGLYSAIWLVFQLPSWSKSAKRAAVRVFMRVSVRVLRWNDWCLPPRGGR